MSIKKLSIIGMVAVFIMALGLVGCGSEKQAGTDKKAEKTAVAAPGSDDAKGFEEFEIGDAVEVGPLHIAPIYFQAVDMEPAGMSLAKEDADVHMEFDVSATGEGDLGYGKDVFVPNLKLTAEITSEQTGNMETIALMPMNASDGPHYGANVKFFDGLGKYNIKLIVGAPDKDGSYLLHVDKETGVTGKFWQEPLIVEWDFDWNGPQW